MPPPGHHTVPDRNPDFSGPQLSYKFGFDIQTGLLSLLLTSKLVPEFSNGAFFPLIDSVIYAF